MKRITALMCSAMLISQLPTAIRAESQTPALFVDNKELSGNSDISDGTHTITAAADGDTVCIAVYEDGRLKAVSLNKTLTYNFSSSGNVIKLMNWDTNMRPLSDGAKIVQNEPQVFIYKGQAQCVPDKYKDFEEYTIELEVVVTNGKITEIRNVNGVPYEVSNVAYIKYALKVADRIIEKQNTNVDAVSGATCASRAIMNAVKTALKSEPINPSTPAPTATPKPSVPDGTYSGTAQCLTKNINYMVDLNVTYNGGKITKIEDMTLKQPMSTTDKELYEKAFNGLDSSLKGKENADDIDVVSGATISSAAIISAVNSAASDKTSKTEIKGDRFAPEGISLYARVYPIVTVENGKITDIRIVPVSGTDTAALNTFAKQIIDTQSVKLDYGSDDEYNIAALTEQALYGKDVLDE